MQLGRGAMTTALASQRGLTLMGLLSGAIGVGLAGYLLIRVLPTVIEAHTIQVVVDRLAAAPAASVPEIRLAFERQRQIDASISSVKGDDLVITQERDRVVIRYAYDKEIELFGPVSVLIKYAGRSK